MNNDFDALMRSIFFDTGDDEKPKANPDAVSQEEKQRIRRRMETLEQENAKAIRHIQRDQPSTSSSSLQQQKKDSLNAVIRDTQAQLEEIRSHLIQDSTVGQSAVSFHPNVKHLWQQEYTAKRLAAFSGLVQAIQPQVIGQEEYLQGVVIAFKRPFVMERSKDRTMGQLMITGPNGSGRHEGLNAMVQQLALRGVLPSGQIETLDLSLYGEQEDTRLFLQDLYRALQQKSSVLLMEHLESCHPAVRSMVTRLVREGILRLDKRYVEQNGILVEAGSALTPGAVGTLTPAGKYLVFLFQGGWGEEKVADVMGASFLNAMDDRCATTSLSREALEQIAQKMARQLQERAEKSLGFCMDEISTQYLAQYLLTTFTLSQGVHSLSQAAQRCHRALVEYRLREDLPVPCPLSVLPGSPEPMIWFDQPQSRPLFALLPKEYQGELERVKSQLREIVGLEQVKEYVLALENHYRVLSLRREKGLSSSVPSMHMIFTGNPGTGKTTIARLMARYLKAIGALSGGQLVEVSRADLVGRYVGHTAPLTTQVIQSALGGVLFIDEAYSLYRGQDDSFGLEAIDTLVKGMEDNREDLVVVLAGYSREMQQFLTANSGLRSRFPNIIEFPDYTAQQLLDITKLLVSQKGYRLDEGCIQPLLTYFTRKQTENARENGNGRMARNLVEKAILRQSKRILSQPDAPMELLYLEDFNL